MQEAMALPLATPTAPAGAGVKPGAAGSGQAKNAGAEAAAGTAFGALLAVQQNETGVVVQLQAGQDQPAAAETTASIAPEFRLPSTAALSPLLATQAEAAGPGIGDAVASATASGQADQLLDAAATVLGKALAKLYPASSGLKPEAAVEKPAVAAGTTPESTPSEGPPPAATAALTATTALEAPTDSAPMVQVDGAEESESPDVPGKIPAAESGAPQKLTTEALPPAVNVEPAGAQASTTATATVAATATAVETADTPAMEAESGPTQPSTLPLGGSAPETTPNDDPLPEALIAARAGKGLSAGMDLGGAATDAEGDGQPSDPQLRQAGLTFRSTAGAPARAAATPDAASIRTQVAERVADEIQGGARAQRLTLRLNPESLGQVDVRFHAQDDRLTVTLQASGADAEKALQENIRDLADRIVERSARYQHVDVRVEVRDGGEAKQDPKQDQKQDGRQDQRQGERREERQHHQGRRPDGGAAWARTWAGIAQED